MSAENQGDRLKEFTGLALFHATSTFDTWCFNLCAAHSYLDTDPAHYETTISHAQTRTCESFNELANVIAADHEIGNLEDRLTALLLIKVGFEQGRLTKLKKGLLADVADNTAVVEIEVQEYMQIAHEFPTDRDLCTIIKEDFAERLKEDIASLQWTKPQPTPKPDLPLSQPDKPPLSRQNLLGLAVLSLLGAGALATLYSMRMGQHKAH
ncbi:MAG TPA: hypothetical protein VN778_05605 [Verrucomicrobiae bacterium]|nr:hypothetical protein [Verrucomicrobiae bacterium]